MKKAALFLSILLYSLSATGQTARIFSSENGLQNSQINRISQDSRGFIWIGTEGGLFRFDGVGFESFRHDRENPRSISSESVHQFFEDSHGTLWVGTAAGLDIFDSEYNTFSLVDLGDKRQPGSSIFISDILEVPDRVSGSSLYISTGGNGIFVIDPDTRKRDDDKRAQLYRSLTTEFIKTCVLDNARHLWIIPEDQPGFFVLNADTLEPATDINLSADLGSNASGIRIIDLCEDPVSRKLLLGTASHGILIYETDSRTLRRARTPQARAFTLASVLYNPLAGGEEGRSFLLGDENGGLFTFDIATEEIRPAVLPGLREGFGRHKATILFSDNQANLWIGIYQSGVMVVPRSMFGFNYLGYRAPGNEGQGSACVMSLCEDAAGRLWVATDGDGLFCQEDARRASHYSRDNSALTNNAIMAVCSDKHGNIWIGTYLDGLFVKPPQGGIRHFARQDRIGSERIRRLAYDEQRDQVYVGTYGAGLVVIDAARQQVVRNIVNDDNLWISALYIDQNGLLWVGTYNGPKRYDAESGTLSPFQVRPDGAPVRVYAISSTQDGTMLFGTGDGIYALAPGSQEPRQYTEQDGLADNVIRDILTTPAGDVWFSTANGLSRYSRTTKSFTTYHASDGLQGNEFRSGAALRSASGRLYFGGTSGVTAFSPLLVDGSTHKIPQVSLSRLTLLDQPVSYDPSRGNNNLIDKHISEATSILIPWHTSLFSVEFSVPEYTNPQRVVYDYRLRGYDDEWKTAPARLRMATYTNVRPGRYMLEVKAHFDGAPEDYSYRAVSLRVEAPWYLKGGAFAIYLLLLAAIVGLLLRTLRARRLHQEEKKDAELKELRLGLFTNLTHEIRTPLTLVMGPLRTLRETEQEPARKDTYNLMYRNCLRINRLVDQLMDIRKIDAGQMPMHFRQTDIIYFIRDIMQSFASLSQSKDINFSLLSAHDEETLWIDQGNFDKIIYNILSNAFKHTPEGGRIRISVSGPTPNGGRLDAGIKEYVEVDIFNSGSRIEEEYISRIFDRFVQVDPYDANTGSGVGLNLTKMLVEMHHGSISAENQEDGVVFRVLVPVGKDHLSAQELSVTTHHKGLYDKGPECRATAMKTRLSPRKPQKQKMTRRSRPARISSW